jgi:hypothetical protein
MKSQSIRPEVYRRQGIAKAEEQELQARQEQWKARKNKQKVTDMDLRVWHRDLRLYRDHEQERLRAQNPKDQ